jgi:hypothetical protein
MPNIDPTTGPAIHVWLRAGPGPDCGVVVGFVTDVALAVESPVDSAAAEAVQAPPEPDPDKH